MFAVGVVMMFHFMTNSGESVFERFANALRDRLGLAAHRSDANELELDMRSFTVQIIDRRGFQLFAPGASEQGLVETDLRLERRAFHQSQRAGHIVVFQVTSDFAIAVSLERAPAWVSPIRVRTERGCGEGGNAQEDDRWIGDNPSAGPVR